jgi:predicted amidohydrolase YtcJ
MVEGAKLGFGPTRCIVAIQIAPAIRRQVCEYRLDVHTMASGGFHKRIVADPPQSGNTLARRRSDMTDAADLLLTNAEVHTLARPDETDEAVAVRGGRIVRVGDAYELDVLAGVDTRVVDCEGRILLPGFVDAHTHLELLGRKLVHADLSATGRRAAALDALRDRAAVVESGDPVLGFGYDESTWGDTDYLTRDDLDAVDAAGPVVAVREDMHVASLDSTALERFGDDLPADGDLTLRIRLNHRADHLDALVETGLRTNHGAGLVRVGAIKTFTDGSLGGRTARLSAPYADAPDERGAWTVTPAAFRDVLDRAERAGFQVAAHAIGDEAVEEVVDAYVGVDPTARHRIEHAELASDDTIDRMAEAAVVASVQPNFHRWAGEAGLYADRLDDRRTETNRLGRLQDAGVRLAFGSDCMPLDPLLGVHHAVNAPTDAQRLGVTDALRAYTLGSAYAGFDENRLGTVEPGKCADLVVLDASPWEAPRSIRDIDVTMTVVDGGVVYDGR